MARYSVALITGFLPRKFYSPGHRRSEWRGTLKGVPSMKFRNGKPERFALAFRGGFSLHLHGDRVERPCPTLETSVGADGETGDFEGLTLSNSGPVFLRKPGLFRQARRGSRYAPESCKVRVQKITVAFNHWVRPTRSLAGWEVQSCSWKFSVLGSVSAPPVLASSPAASSSC